MRLRATICWGPGTSIASPDHLLCLDLLHWPCPIILMTWSFSDQSSLRIICQLLWWEWQRWGIWRCLLLVFILSDFALFCFVRSNCCCWGLISWSQSFLPLTRFTLWLIYFSYFPKDLLTVWKVFYLDTILVFYLVFLLFFPSCFLLINHKESVSRQTSLTE